MKNNNTLTKKQRTYRFSRMAELISSFYLRLKFYHVIAHRFKSPFGEIDLIATKGSKIIFLEIKARQDTNLMDFISKRQQQRIINTAEYFLLKEAKYKNYYIRFDVIIMNSYFWPKHFKSYW
jgi:putative endonuclease